ncbi:MAG: efflux RND transporter periplasmic adaptor subunit [Byssovorax sp.]
MPITTLRSLFTRAMEPAWSLRVALAAASIAGAAGCHHGHAAEAVEAPPGEIWISARQATTAQITTTAAAEHEVGGMLVTSGRIAFDDLRVSHVYSPVAGRVTKISAELGEHVKKGQALATIDSPDLGMASADLAKAEADVIAAEHDFTRQKSLYELRAVAQRDYEAAEDNYRKAKAELERARQKAHLLGKNQGPGQGYVLRTLIDGAVVSRNLNLGMELGGQYAGGSPVELFTIGDIDQVWVLADAFEMDLPRIKAGERVSVKVVSYPDKSFEGTVDWVSDTLDPTTHTARVRCAIPNPEHLLKPEMFATVSIAVAGDKKLAVPRSSVLHLGEQAVVFVKIEDRPDGKIRFERRPVLVDEDQPGDLVPVLRGVSAGEHVVSAGGILLSTT